MEDDLYFSKKSGEFFLLFGRKCGHCNKELDKFCFMLLKSDNDNSINDYFCNFCISKISKREIQGVTVVGIIKKGELPKDAILIFNPNIEFNSTKGYYNSIVKARQMATTPSLKTEDNTVYSNLSSIEGAKIGMDIKEEDQTIQIDYFLHEVQEAIPYLPEDKKMISLEEKDNQK